MERLEKIYCEGVGFEYFGFCSAEIESFIEKSIESSKGSFLSDEQKKVIHRSLCRAESFEQILHLKFPGEKRFSLEGGETLIPMVEALIEAGAEKGVKAIVMGMAHRGRVSVLANILGKPYAQLRREFDKTYRPEGLRGLGDVKYHQGYASTFQTKMGRLLHFELSPNPSHLEAIDPVVEGKVRALQDQKYQGDRRSVLPLLIHGDASIAGQGVVYETLQLSKLEGYQTGGTIHLVVNNQVGFTANPEETKSTPHCTDIVKSFGAPVFHLNSEDPEACLQAITLALEIRQTFKSDLFLKLNCFRKYRHNEMDEPLFTQPLLYQRIKKKEGPRAKYQERLIKEGVLTEEEAQEVLLRVKKEIEDAPLPPLTPPKFKRESPQIKAVPLSKLQEYALALIQRPEGFELHPKINRLLEQRLEMLKGDPKVKKIDFGMAEQLAFASLLTEGISIRLSGQDSGRGTFSHRHAILVDQKSGERYIPLSHLSSKQASFSVYNSPLSEYAVMGFE